MLGHSSNFFGHQLEEAGWKYNHPGPICTGPQHHRTIWGGKDLQGSPDSPLRVELTSPFSQFAQSFVQLSFVRMEIPKALWAPVPKVDHLHCNSHHPPHPPTMFFTESWVDCLLFYHYAPSRKIWWHLFNNLLGVVNISLIILSLNNMFWVPPSVLCGLSTARTCWLWCGSDVAQVQ